MSPDRAVSSSVEKFLQLSTVSAAFLAVLTFDLVLCFQYAELAYLGPLKTVHGLYYICEYTVLWRSSVSGAEKEYPNRQKQDEVPG